MHHTAVVPCPAGATGAPNCTCSETGYDGNAAVWISSSSSWDACTCMWMEGNGVEAVGREVAKTQSVICHELALEALKLGRSCCLGCSKCYCACVFGSVEDAPVPHHLHSVHTLMPLDSITHCSGDMPSWCCWFRAPKL